MRTFRRANPRLLTTATIALAGSALAAPSAVAGASTPPELPPLLAKMKALQLSSERFTGTVKLHAHKLPKQLAALRALTIQLEGETTLTAPRSATVTASALGHKTTVREIGTTVYTLDPTLGTKDGGKPWVVQTLKAEPSAGASPGLAGGGAAPYATFAEVLESAKTAKSLGTSTVAGQPVTRFELGGVDVAKLGELSAKTRTKLAREHIHPKASLEVDLNGEGLPVHTAGVITLGKVGVDFGADVLAVNVPVSVAAPAPTETITAQEVLALLKSSTHKK